MDTLINSADVLVNLWLLIILYRRGIRKHLPWFVSYIGWEVVSGSFGLAVWLFGRELYGSVYWGMELVEITLIVAAVRESFLRIFRGFSKIPAFRRSIWGLIGAVVVYSAWKAVYAPPLFRVTRFGTFEIAAEFLVRCGILAIWFLTTILSALLSERTGTREDAVVTGFAVFAAGFLLYLGSFSIFGAKVTFITKYLPPVGYFLAAGWWIWVFTRPIEEFGFKELGMGPDDIRKKVRQFREHADMLAIARRRGQPDKP